MTDQSDMKSYVYIIRFMQSKYGVLPHFLSSIDHAHLILH